MRVRTKDSARRHPFAARARMAYKPGALRSLDVCLDSRGPFIDAFGRLCVFGVLHRIRELTR
jgi:hypothetical protein